MRRKSSLALYRMAIVAVLSALGVVLMLYVKIPYPLASWCEIEISDLTVVVGYVLTGFPGALSIAFIKTLIHLLVMPTNGFGGAPYVGDLAALLSSLLYLLAIEVLNRVFHLFRKGFLFRLLAYVLLALFVSLGMTLLNMLFITPSFLAPGYTTCFDSEAVKGVEESLGQMGFPFSYPIIILAVYIPFNLLKSALILALYEVLFNTLFFRLMKNNAIVLSLTGKEKDKKNVLTEGLSVETGKKKQKESDRINRS